MTTFNLRNLNSVAGLKEAFQFLDMPEVSDKAATLILRDSECSNFVELLKDCLGVDGRRPSTTTKQFVFGYVSCLSITFTRALEKIGYNNLPLETLHQIGKKSGFKFRELVNQANSGDEGAMKSIKQIIDGTPQGSCDAIKRSVPSPSSSPPPSVQDQVVAKLDSSFTSTHVYGASFALCFNAELSRSGEHVIMIDAAPSSGRRQYEWQKKMTIQLGHKELPILFAVLMGWLNEFRFGAHGDSNEKAFEIKRQEDSFHASLSVKGTPTRSVKITTMDSFYVSTIVFSQILKQVPQNMREHPPTLINILKQSVLLSAKGE